MPWTPGDPPDKQGKKLLYSEPNGRPKRRERSRDRNRSFSQFQLTSLQGLGPNDLVPRPRLPPVHWAAPTPDPIPDPMYMETLEPIDYDKVLLPKDQKRTLPVCKPLSPIKGAKFTSRYATTQQKILPMVGVDDCDPEVTKIIWPSSGRRTPKLIEPNLKALVERPRGYKQDASGASRGLLRSEDPAPLTAAQKYGYSPVGEPLASIRTVMNTAEEEPDPNAYVVGSNKKFAKRLLKKRRKQDNYTLSAENAPPIESGQVTERPTSGRRSSPIPGSPLPGMDRQRKSKSPIEEDVSKKTKTEEKKSIIGRKHTLAENKAWYAKYKAGLFGEK